MGTPLARISAATDVPRGPDVLHRVEVARDWFQNGARLSIELPRNLTCAGCRGGGCDACLRAGAITLWERGAPPEVVDVTLGSPSFDSGASELTMRIPERGGHPSSPNLPRGLLMLTLTPASASHPSVRQDIDLEPRSGETSVVPRPSHASTMVRIGLLVLAIGIALWLLLGR